MDLETVPTIRNTFGLSVQSQALYEGIFLQIYREQCATFSRKLNWCVIGDASNAILPPFFPVAVLRDTNTGIRVDGNYVRAAAGCSWDELVSFTIMNGLYGLENSQAYPAVLARLPFKILEPMVLSWLIL